MTHTTSRGFALCALLVFAIAPTACGREDSLAEAESADSIKAAETAATSQAVTADLEASVDTTAPKDSGFVEIDMNAKVAPLTVKNVGGGTWNYGHSGQHCWSHYVHNTKKHSATAIMGSQNKKVFANATVWANADIYGSGTCYAYWATY